jgi:hypothetical protein
MVRAVALPFDGSQLPVKDRRNRSPASQPYKEWLAALAATFLFPRERKLSCGQAPFLVERGRPLLLLKKGFIDRYRSLFLSRS